MRPALYDIPVSAVFGDNPALGEIPYDPATGFDYDNTYLQNRVQVTLSQGPNTLAAPVIRSPASIQQYFQRGLQQTISAQTTQDAIDRATWSETKYQQPSVRVRTLKTSPSSNPATFTQLLQIDVSSVVTVNRRPIGPAGNAYNLPVQIGKVQHDIGPGVWDITYQMYPYVIEGNVLRAGWSFTVAGTPSSGNFFTVTGAQGPLINVGDSFTDVNNPGVTFTVTEIGPNISGSQNVSITPTAASIMSSPDVVTQTQPNTLGSNAMAW